jgi:hypothetical protein
MTRKVRVVSIAVALAAIAVILISHRHHSRNTVVVGIQPVTVLVAKKAIPKGTPARIIASKPLYVAKTLPASQKLRAAIPDPFTLRGTVTVRRIPAGQQLTAADFGRPTG